MDANTFPMFKVELKLNGKEYWAEHIFCSFPRAAEFLKRARHKKDRRIARINNAAELEQAESEAERLADWASDYDYTE